MVTEPTVFTNLIGSNNSYKVFVSNSSGRALTGSTPVVVKFTHIDPGFTPDEISGLDMTYNLHKGEAGWACSLEELECVYSGPMPVGDVFEVELRGATTATGGTLSAEASIEGGGAGFSTRSVSATAEVGVEAAEKLRFGVSEFNLNMLGARGEPETQAGGRSTELEFGFQMNTIFSRGDYRAPRELSSLKNVTLDLPPGLIGYTQSLPKCSLEDFTYAEGGFSTRCPSASRMGSVLLEDSGYTQFSGVTEVSYLYNLQPEAGYPVEFGFVVEGRYPIVTYGRLVHTSSGYVVQTTTSSPHALSTIGGMISLYGNPGARDGSGVPTAFFRNPTGCEADPADARLELESWAEPGWRPALETPVYPATGLTGCDALQFGFPAGEGRGLESGPAGVAARQTDSPSGYGVVLTTPQTPALFGGALGSPDLRNATVTLPPGVVVSPPSGNGLQACSAGEFYNEPEGKPTTPADCPAASEVGEAELRTPLLEAKGQPFTGEVYIAQPECDPCTQADAQDGKMVHLYLQVEGPETINESSRTATEERSDFYVKLTGTAKLNPETGQITTTFENNPQLPFTEFKIKLKDGPKAPLATPPACGTYTTTSLLEPWGAPETPNATPSGTFVTSEDCTDPFTPAFSAGVTNTVAGEYSPFTLTLSRQDHEQDIAGLSTTLPVGLLAAISHVSLCPEPLAAQGNCPEASRIGTVHAAAGSGPEPLWETGSAYLTGPYNGAPFGLSVVVPAVAGPFNLGNVVVQAAIHINPTTAAVTVISNPFPQLVDGIPLRMKTVNITLDRPGFTLNPTSCTPKAITGTVTSAQGTTMAVSSPFDVGGCQNLPFKPSLSASTQGTTSKAAGASLTVKVTSAPGQANIAKVDLQLPKQLPSRLTTLQKACTEAQFNTNPAGCPEASDIGTAKAVTPILSAPLTGPAYLVSHGGAAFPDVEFVLQGENGVQIVLDGGTQIKNGVTYSKFESVPDTPISSFETVLPEGPHSVLSTDIPTSAKNSLCGQALTIPTTITGQNGAVFTQTTKIAVTGCAKVKTKALTRAQKLAKALKACRKEKNKTKRASCVKQARKKYGPVKTKKKKK
jgi:hypothetical protein